MVGASEQVLSDYASALRLAPRDAQIYIERGVAYGAAGKHALAVNDFDHALEHDPNSSRALYARGKEAFANGDDRQAQADLTRAFKLASNEPYSLIWLHLSQRRLGNVDLKSLGDNLKGAGKYWPYPLLQYFHRTGDEAAVRRAATEGVTPSDAADHLCEVDYYLGALARVEGRTKAVHSLLRKAAATCPPGFVELYAVRRDLKAMGE